MAVQETASSTYSIGNIKKFLREVKGELKKVTWPNRQQLTAYTSVVLITVILVSLLIWILDTSFAYLFHLFLKS